MRPRLVSESAASRGPAAQPDRHEDAPAKRVAAVVPSTSEQTPSPSSDGAAVLAVLGALGALYLPLLWGERPTPQSVGRCDDEASVERPPPATTPGALQNMASGSTGEHPGGPGFLLRVGTAILVEAVGKCRETIGKRLAHEALVIAVSVLGRALAGASLGRSMSDCSGHAPVTARDGRILAVRRVLLGHPALPLNLVQASAWINYVVLMGFQLSSERWRVSTMRDFRSRPT